MADVSAAVLDRWRARGVEVEVLAPFGARPLAERLDAARADGIALWGLDEALEHALGRSCAHQQTPAVVFFEGDEGLSSGAHLDAPFTEDPLPVAAPSGAWDAAVRRLAADPRVRFVFRTAWHARALADRLGEKPFARAVVVPPAAAPTPGKPARLPRVVFPALVQGARRDGADLLVRTVVELSHRPGVEALELAVVGERVRDEALLPVPVLRLSGHDALATAHYAVLTRRDGRVLHEVVECLARGVTPVPLAHPALGSFFGRNLGVADDPAAVADLLLTLVHEPAKRRAYLKGLATLVASRCAPAAVTEAELAAFAPPPPWKRRPLPAPLLTVAVPSWNAEKTLARCVRSLTRADTTGRLEVLVVNDGSTDGTGALADALAAELPGIVRVVHQENRGHGGAINAGLAAARGRYFRVVDADDWVDSLALAQLVATLRTETVDVVLTSYAEDRPDAPLPRPVNILGRLPAGAVCRFDTIVDPHLGLTSWGPLLSTSTFRTEFLRRAKLSLTEHSAYVDLEYCTLGLEFVETMRHLPLEIYRYSLGAEGQSVSPASYRRRYKEHEAVILRLCRFARHNQHLSPAKRRYVLERVIAPVIDAHLVILREQLEDAKAEKAFVARLAEFDLAPRPAPARVKTLARETLKAALPEHLVGVLRSARDPASVAREVGRYALPALLTRFFQR
jgi:hypothetical protein